MRKLVITLGVLWGFMMIRKYLLTSNTNEIDLLARTIWGEARGEGVDGMKAIANVIMNRVKKGGWWGSTVADVVLFPKQFSCWNENDVNYIATKNVTEDDDDFYWLKNIIAPKAISGNLPDNTDGATHYHAVYVKPSWVKSMKQTATIGNHIFYK